MPPASNASAGRLNRLELLVEKLTDISSDLKGMLAVHEQRLSQHDKEYTHMEDIIEKRRVELDAKVDAIYNTMRDQDNRILEEIQALREESLTQHKKLSEKMAQMEKYVWIAIGGGIVVTFIISNFSNYFQLFVK